VTVFHFPRVLPLHSEENVTVSETDQPQPVADQPRQSLRQPRLLVLELWGLGDLTFSTPMLRQAVEKFSVTLVGKAHARPLLAGTFPEIEFVAYDAPWSAYKDKYRLWRWNWRELMALIGQLRRHDFDAAVSVRNDPRDHLLLLLAGAKRRYAFPVRGSSAFLTDPLVHRNPKQHRVEDWREIGRALGFEGMDVLEPRLEHARYRSPRVDALLKKVDKPMVCLHPGARIPVRRWPEANFAYVVQQMRGDFDFHLALVPDPDGYGLNLAPLADTILPPLDVSELVDVLGRAELLLCNDSGPGHIASCCGRPAIVVFGPTDPDWFRPWGDIHHLVIRDICPWRPCFDYCKFPEPYCITMLKPDRAWPRIREHMDGLIERGVLPTALRKQ
jgi:ADP-heptose:LPS heptosyltransferase